MRLLHLMCLALTLADAAGLAGCTDDLSGWAAPDPYEDLDRLQREGPPRYASRVHSCPKLRYRTLGNVLASRGVDLMAGLKANGEVSAGQLYREGTGTLGAPNYLDRVRENIDLGIATASRTFDILVQAAPEIIANLPRRPECQIGGIGAPLFDGANRCVADGVSCLIGVPATAAHLEICNQTVRDAADVEAGKRLAVAVLAAAAHTCE